MNPASESIPETTYSHRISKLVKEITEHAEGVCLSKLETPKWALPEEQRRGRVKSWLYRLYSSRNSAFPVRFWLSIALWLYLVLQYNYLALLSTPSTWVTLGGRIQLIGGGLLLLLLFIYGMIGSCWNLFEIVVNRGLSWKTRAFCLLCVTAVVGCWILGGSASLEVSRSLGEMLIPVVIVAFFNLPVFIHFALWLVGITTLIIVGALSLVQWLFKYHSTAAIESLDAFLSKPMFSYGTDELRVLVELDEVDLESLCSWALRCKEISQSRLVPTTLVFTFLGLLANTSMGESAVQYVKNLFLGLPLQSPMGLSWAVMSGRLILLSALGGILITLVANLLNKGFTADYIAQACILALHEKRSRQKQAELERSRAEAKKREESGFLGWLGRWLGQLLAR